MNFQILPAINLHKGKVVQLYKGSREQMEFYPQSPVAYAEAFAEEGGDFLHIVDLDGVSEGKPAQLKTIGKIVKSVKIPIQVGGGIREISQVEELFALGVARVVVGTQAIETPAFVEELLKKFGEEKIVISLAARESGEKIATRGWENRTEINVIDFAESLEKLGVERITYTDIARDGTLTFPDFDVVERLRNTTKLKILAGGGVTEIQHVVMLKQLGCEGVIIGKAL
ncbi:MAG: 1-(5-phosphoribosyl)-5-[(5-phosphoribosylamino)methylideneamino]imidazole-4-carboxamide isomerase, partial [Candidatus Gracilibacteria bacterium]|nr:1-(5-phosphoribosyl)-5-[(5-phosphoribosylamino)methylideneamino]imidazole-4-carboxamide isomerase [Candidatus Gracilibacteria bacterium]